MTHPKQILARYNIYPKKQLGQNFLVSDSILEDIAAAASLSDSDEVLEIGPGTGNLTLLLAERAKRVVGIEADIRLIPILYGYLEGIQNVEIINEDVLQIHPADFFDGPYKAVGNLPYYITGAIFRQLLSQARKPSLLTFTVQKEVAQRITARPGKMSLFALTVQYFGEVQYIRTIKAGSFWPRPEVDSALIRLKVSDSPPLSTNEEADFFELAKVGFSQKRKQLQKNLRQLGLPKEALESGLMKAKIDGKRRAETLAIQEWLDLYNSLYSDIAPAR